LGRECVVHICLKRMTHQKKDKQTMMTTDCLADVLYQVRSAKKSTSKTATLYPTLPNN